MKKLLLILSVFMAANAFGGDISGEGTYYGKVSSVAVGFFSHVGVGLPVGETCHGQPIVVLQTTHPLFKEMYSLLLAAKASQADVEIERLGAEETTFGVGYCVINYLSLDDFPAW